MTKVGEVAWSPRPVERRSDAQLKEEWNAVAAFRHGQITNGQDLSYVHVLSPCLLDLLPNSRRLRVLDAGCGTGGLAREIARRPLTSVVAIDPSAESIRIAGAAHKDCPSLRFGAVSIQEYGADAGAGRFDAVIANMVLENTSDLPGFLAAARLLLQRGGAFLVAIPHPCFWPRHWGYEAAPWFSYEREVWIEAPFRTSLSITPGPATTHVHRPLGVYVEALSRAGFWIERMVEPYPSPTVRDLYPEDWRFPRFLVLRCRLLRGGSR